MSDPAQIYIGHDNAIERVLTEDGAPVQLDSITRVVLTINGVDYDSDELGSDVMWWTDTKESDYFEETVDVLKIKLGGQAGLVAGVYSGCRLVIYDADNTAGVVWENDIVATVA